jgi:hypothetical protein
MTTIHCLSTWFGERDAAGPAAAGLLSVFDVASVNGEVLHQVLEMGWRDFEDAVQVAAAIAAGATHLVTRNVTDYRGAPLPVLKPAEVVPLLPALGREER